MCRLVRILMRNCGGMFWVVVRLLVLIMVLLVVVVSWIIVCIVYFVLVDICMF